MKPQFLVHDERDNVGVAVIEIVPGENISGACLENGKQLKLVAKDAVPLGHKVALADIKKGASVIKYGVTIGQTTQSVTTGQHVHVHNLKTNRW